MAPILLLIILLPSCLIELIAWKKPYRQYRGGVGYRSQRANMTDATWIFAQKYSGRIGFNCGIILLLTGIPAILLLEHFFDASVSTAFAILLLILNWIINYYLTEKKLKQLFDKNGHPIN